MMTVCSVTTVPASMRVSGLTMTRMTAANVCVPEMPVTDIASVRAPTMTMTLAVPSM